ncbi:glutaredoxin domain-containing protein [Glutamicibacter sp. NPDC087583]|uniref:glutaredoxin domain-containing protein n=1 Tax=Glutamicibacter sp. NPDC087583 TaxID=3363995 RepID=UPI003821B424
MTVQSTFADPAPVAVVFTRKHCGPCGATVRRFEALGIPHEVRDLAEHLQDAERLRRQGHMQAPVVEPTSPSIPAWSGFRPERIATLADYKLS